MRRRRRRRLGNARAARPVIAPYGGLGQVGPVCAPIAPGKRIRLCLQRVGKPGPQITGPKDVCRLLRGAGNADRESFYALHLDRHNRVIGIEEVSRGTVGGVEVHPRETFKSAFLTNASGLIVAHNHPSALTDPSAQDRELTRQLVDGGRLLGVPVLDHVIVGADDCHSMRDRGWAFGAVRRRRRRRRRRFLTR